VSREELSWECDVPLVTNPVVLRQVFVVFLLVPLIACGVLVLPLWREGSLDSLPMLLAMMFAVSGGLMIAGLLGALVLLGNRSRMSFRLTRKGVTAETIDPRVKRIGWITMVLGLLTGKPGAAGAGMLTLSHTRQSTTWRTVQKVRINGRRRMIELSNGWRTIMVLYCTPDNHEGAVRMVNAHVPKHMARQRSSPVWAALGWTLAAMIAALPAFAMDYPFEVELLPLMLLVCFAAASIWLIPLLAWVTFACSAFVVSNLVWSGLEIRQSMFPDRPPFRAYESASVEDWLQVVVCIAGLAFLMWMSRRLLNGKLQSVLMKDMSEMGDV
jgi:hypothetical protein